MTQATATAAQSTVLDANDPELTRNYAEALIGAASAGGEAEAALDDLDALLAEVLTVSPHLAELLVSPAVGPDEKDQILLKAFEGRSHPTVLRFLRVLNRNGRMANLGEIAREARRLWDRRQGRRHVTVRSAVPLDEGQRDDLRGRLAPLVGGEPIVRLEVDPALIGGLVVQVGDDVYDASVRNRLEQLRRRLVEGKTHEIQRQRDRFGS